MAVYYINLAITLALGIPLCLYKPNKLKKLIFIVVSLGFMWFLATFRKDIGYDYNVYIRIFEEVRGAQGLEGLFALTYEKGFVLLTKLMTLFIHDSVVMYGVYAALVLVPIGWFVYRHCKDAWFSLWLFATLTFFYTSMNFVRQSISCSIIVLGYGFLRDKKMVKFLLIVVLAALFHRTALIMVPVYFLCHIKINKKWAIFYGSVTVVTYLCSQLIWDFVTNFIFTYYKDSIYANYFSPIFLVVPVAVFAGSLSLWPVWRKRYPEADMLLNLMMYAAIIWLFITKHFILERFSMYIYVFVLVALPQAIESLACPQEDHDRLTVLKAESGKKGSKTKVELAEVRTLSARISDHRKYYWSAVIAMLLLTLIYHEFGANVNGTNGFHKVFPYHSVIEWMDTKETVDPGTAVTAPAETPSID